MWLTWYYQTDLIDSTSGPGCSNQGKNNTGLVRNLNSDVKAYKSNSVLFFLSTIWWLHFLKRIEEITRENAFEQTKKKPGLKFYLGLAIIGFPTTGPRDLVVSHTMHISRHNRGIPRMWTDSGKSSLYSKLFIKWRWPKIVCGVTFGRPQLVIRVCRPSLSSSGR